MAGPDGDEAMPRAKRLKLLREAKARKERAQNGIGDASAPSAEAEASPADEPMQEESDKKEQDEDEDMPSAADSIEEGLVEKITQAEEDAKTEDEDEDELLNLAPKRANWDMERDIAPMLRKLEKRTQHAIVEILREKLAAEQREEDEEDDDDDDDDEEEEEVE